MLGNTEDKCQSLMDFTVEMDSPHMVVIKVNDYFCVVAKCDYEHQESPVWDDIRDLESLGLWMGSLLRSPGVLSSGVKDQHVDLIKH